MAAIDLAAATIVTIALLRGLFLGLVREACSLGAIAGACIVVRLAAAPLGEWLVRLSGGEIGPTPAPWIAGIALGVATLVAVRIAGMWLQRGVKAVGFSWADRLGGAALGAAEGALVVAVLIAVAVTALGRDHEAFEGTRSLEALERLEWIAQERGWPTPHVAAPPPLRRR